jgi:hypothetical protein
MIKVAPINEQRRARELGIIRIGEKVAAKKGDGTPTTRPAMRETFRITSAYKPILEAVALVYGGEIRPWAERLGHWELDTPANELRVMINHQHSLSRWYERWAQGGCTHRCDGETCIVTAGGEPVERDCMCDPDNRKCDTMTRLNVMLSDVPILGTWRLNSKGKIFGSEVQAAFDMMDAVGLNVGVTYCLLQINQQEIKKPGKAARKFSIPSLMLDPNPPNFAAVIQGVQQRQLTGQPASVPMIEAPKPQFEEPTVTLPFEPCEQVDPAVFNQSNTSWIHCDTCSFIVASLKHGNGKRRHYNHDGRQHKPLCGQPTGWNEIPPIEGDFREAA